MKKVRQRNKSVIKLKKMMIKKGNDKRENNNIRNKRVNMCYCKKNVTKIFIYDLKNPPICFPHQYYPQDSNDIFI